MKHYEFTTVKAEHARLKAHTAELYASRTELQALERQQHAPHVLDNIREGIAKLDKAIAEAQYELSQMETSNAWVQAVETEKARAQREQQRALEQRRSDRLARKQAEREAYDAEVGKIDWSLVSVPQRAKRELAREHIDKLHQTAKQRELLAQPALLAEIAAQERLTVDQLTEALVVKSFETVAVDRETGKRYVIVTDGDGYTYADHDLGGSDGSDGS